MLGPPPGGGDSARDDDVTAAQSSHRVVVAAAPSSSSSSSSFSPRDHVIACADRLHRGDLDGARRAAEFLLSRADPTGDAADRLAHHFARALARHVDVGTKAAAPSPPSTSAYLAYNQIAPFLRFAHLTANQAILEATAAVGPDPAGRRRVHIVDLDAAHGVQWPPLLQAMAERAHPPEVRITGAGTDPDVLRRTGDRLRAFAASLNLPSFSFHPLHLPPCPAQLAASLAGLELHPDETLAVNCVLFLHRLRGDEVVDFLRWVKSMNPAVVTIAEREEAGASSNSGECAEGGDLPRRVAAAMDHYAAVFDALEAMVPPGSADRLAVEREVLGQEIDAAVGPAAGWRRARGFEWWASAARAAGMAPRPLSTFAVAQARFLLRLHYQSEGYEAEEARGACFLGWQRRPLMSVSSWQ